MPQVDAYGHTVPSLTDGPPNITQALTDFGASIHPTVVADSLTHASQIVSEWPAGTFPAFAVIVSETSQYVKVSKTSQWERLGGRDHGFKAKLFQVNLPKNQYQNLGVGPLIKASEGWAISSDQVAITFPEDGIYGIKVMVDVSGLSTDITRARCQFTVNGAWAGRVTLDADDIITPSTSVDVKKGDKLITYYHWTGPRTTHMSLQDGEIMIYRIAKPRWT